MFLSLLAFLWHWSIGTALTLNAPSGRSPTTPRPYTYKWYKKPATPTTPLDLDYGFVLTTLDITLSSRPLSIWCYTGRRARADWAYLGPFECQYPANVTIPFLDNVEFKLEQFGIFSVRQKYRCAERKGANATESRYTINGKGTIAFYIGTESCKNELDEYGHDWETGRTPYLVKRGKCQTRTDYQLDADHVHRD